MTRMNDMGEFIDEELSKTMKLGKSKPDMRFGVFVPMDKPERTSKSRFVRIIDAFARSDEDCIGKEYKDRALLKKDYERARYAAKKTGCGVKVSRSGSVLYFEKGR